MITIADLFQEILSDREEKLRNALCEKLGRAQEILYITPEQLELVAYDLLIYKYGTSKVPECYLVPEALSVIYERAHFMKLTIH